MLIVFTPDNPTERVYVYLNEWINNYDYCHFKTIFQTQNKPTELFQHLSKFVSCNNFSSTHKLVLHLNEVLINNKIHHLNELLKRMHLEYNISRFHFSEKLLELLFYQQKFEIFHQYNISASIHHLDIKEIHNHLSYIIYGPVFPSITKQNYAPEKNIHELKQPLLHISESIEIPIIAIGGITAENFHIPLDTGFSGVALRGYIWEHPNPNASFKTFIEQWKTYKNQ